MHKTQVTFAEVLVSQVTALVPSIFPDTLTAMYLPFWAVFTANFAAFSPEIRVHVLGMVWVTVLTGAVHEYHWYVNVKCGPPSHAPLAAVSLFRPVLVETVEPDRVGFVTIFNGRYMMSPAHLPNASTAKPTAFRPTFTRAEEATPLNGELPSSGSFPANVMLARSDAFLNASSPIVETELGIEILVSCEAPENAFSSMPVVPLSTVNEPAQLSLPMM